MKIVFVSAEAAPLAKVGGLADVAGALPKELIAQGHDVRLVMPSYPLIESNPKYALEPVSDHFPVLVGDQTRVAYANKTEVNGVPVYLVGSKSYFQEATESKKIYVPGAEPYVFFCGAVLELIRRFGPDWRPDVIHCNDWHTGLIPVYLHTRYATEPAFRDAATVITIHNLAYQGEFGTDVLGLAGLPDSLYTMDELECYGKVNLMKGGIVFSDLVNTVSETYACEIQSPEFGCNLDGLLRHVSSQGRLRGILNGLDYCEFNPETDKRICRTFGHGDLDGKKANKTDLQRTLGLPERADAPLFGLVSRLVDQKGLDLLKAVMPEFVKMDVQFALLGTGDAAYETFFKDLEGQCPDKVKAYIGFDTCLAQKIYAGSDVFLMPSKFEPCGLGQMISLRYGTVPLVRATGGLADTISEFSPKDLTGNGFVFSGYDAAGLLSAIERAVETYQFPNQWRTLVLNGMSCDYSCGTSAAQYVEFYQDAMERAHTRAAA